MTTGIHAGSARAGVLALFVSLAGAPLAGCAGLAGPPSLQLTAQSALPGRGNVRAEQRPDGVVVLRGWVEDRIGEMAVLRDVGNYPGVTGIVNLIRPPYLNLY